MERRDLYQVAEKYKSKLEKIKVALFDVDGILTDGKLYYSGSEIGYNRFFNARDGYGLKVLKEAGIKVGIISGGNSIGVRERFQENLKLDYIYMGNEDKREAYKEIISLGYTSEEILYMGDEFFDLPILEVAGFSASVPQAGIEIRTAVDYVTEANAGDGSAREVIDILRYAQGIVPKIHKL